jgi:phospholipase C
MRDIGKDFDLIARYAMTYSVEHLYIDTFDFSEVTPVVGHPGVVRVSYSASGDLPIRHPGQLNVFVHVLYYTQTGGEPPSAPGHDPAIGQSSAVKVENELPMSTSIFSPDGNLFTADQVTLADLERFRNLREVSQGTWRYETSGLSAPIYTTGPPRIWVTEGMAIVKIWIEEIVTSRSAGPLVSASGSAAIAQVHSFDLFRVGQFIAQVRMFGGIIDPTARLRLIDPDGAVVASANQGSLAFPVTLQTVDKSRDVNGQVRPWGLECTTAGPNPDLSLSATVVTTTRIPVSMLQQRIDDLLGPNGEKLLIFGENKDGNALCRLKIVDDFSAETIAMLGLLDDVLKKNPQDPSVDLKNIDIQKNVEYSIAHRKQDLDYDLTLDVGAISVTMLRVRLGASQHIQPSIPAITVDIAVNGEIDVDLEDFTLASLTLNNNLLTLEVGLGLDSTGSITLQSWLTPDPINIDLQWEAAVLAGVLDATTLLLQGADFVTAYIQHEVNDKIVSGFSDIVESAILNAPKIMAMLLGAAFTLQSLQIANDAIVIDYVAPVEPEPKPNPEYIGVIGRLAMQAGPNAWQFSPPSLGDTWAADNLSKIEHIVVVMMENRSFDHVIGYRQLVGDVDGDGGYRDLIAFLNDQGFPVTLLRNSGIAPDPAGFKTKFPAQVGHKLSDVAQQLASQLQTSFGVTVNSPQGFIDNFADRVTGGLVATDILGTYDATDLPFYGFLAENYAYCERYFAAHPGPTLPNRMYSLGGDVQYDRVGEAIIDNNNSDNFALSRALNIFDVLTRKAVSWRVYESFPSVTMLRMFARYVGDNTNILPIANLKDDIASGNLPSVVFIDPAMQHAPENDDHPVADMLYGQIFLKSIYDDLLANQALWLRTLLIISYDEHGGFYDNVVPPTAEIRTLPDVLAFATSSGFKSTLTTPYGVRVPAFVVSPWVAAGKGPNIALDHCSILKTILARFCGSAKPFLSDRVNASLTFNSFLTQAQPRLGGIPPSPSLPSLPSLPTNMQIAGAAIATKPVSRRALRKGDADFHDLTGMLARMLGRPYVRTEDDEFRTQ